MLPVVWRPRALRQLENIGIRISRDDPVASDRLQAKIERVAEAIPLHPHMHRPGRLPGTREAVAHPNYIIVYQVSDKTIDVLAVMHARQQYPDSLS